MLNIEKITNIQYPTDNKQVKYCDKIHTTIANIHITCLIIDCLQRDNE